MDSPIYAINFFVSIIGIVIIVNWLYYKNNRSILAAAVAHSAVNAAGVLIAATPTTDLIATSVFIVVAVVIVLLDRAHFGDGPRTFLTMSPGDPGLMAADKTPPPDSRDARSI